MKLLIVLALLLGIFPGCRQRTKETREPVVMNSSAQDSMFKKLTGFAQAIGLQMEPEDSLSILIMPLQASCPSCLEKAIDSLVYYKDRLPVQHYIVLSISGGKKTIRGYFREYDQELPDIPGRLLLDTVNQSDRYGLHESNPTIYYAVNGKVYRKISAIPATIKGDLQEFYTGVRKKM